MFSIIMSITEFFVHAHLKYAINFRVKLVNIL